MPYYSIFQQLFKFIPRYRFDMQSSPVINQSEAGYCFFRIRFPFQISAGISSRSCTSSRTRTLTLSGEHPFRLRSNSLTAELKSETRTAPPPSCAFLPARTEISCLDETVVPEIEPVLARLKLSPGQRAARHQPSMSQTRPR